MSSATIFLPITDRGPMAGLVEVYAPKLGPTAILAMLYIEARQPTGTCQNYSLDVFATSVGVKKSVLVNALQRLEKYEHLCFSIATEVAA